MMYTTVGKSRILQIKPWRPDKPVSKGATAYHDAVANARYYISILDELVKKIRTKIREGDIVVDFGAGTGISAMRIFKQLKADVKVWLVDNSPAWLGKAYEIFSKNSYVEYFLLEKTKDKYVTLADSIGEESVNHVISANTVHLIPDLEYTFNGINMALKPGGTFSFQSGNILRNGKDDDILLIDDTFNMVHDIAIDIVKTDKKFAKYKDDIDERIESQSEQRKFVFPNPRPLKEYLKSLKNSGFSFEKPEHRLFKIPYKGWLDFLRVKRLQAGILPEIGKDIFEEEQDRDELITMASKRLFHQLQQENKFADKNYFTIECTYVTAVKGF